MNTALRLTMLATFAVGASAQDSANCQYTLALKDIAPSAGPGVAIQPVFVRDGMKGWRLYGTEKSEQLRSQAIWSGSLITHICGVPASDIRRGAQDVCCSTDVSREFELTFEINGEVRKVVIKRPS